MSQHFTRATVEASAWCARCWRLTPHVVSDRRLQYCIPCYQKNGAAQIKSKPAAPSPSPTLFDNDENPHK